MPSFAADLDSIAGVYKTRKQNGIYNGLDSKGEQIIDKYISEDVLEIIPYKENSFYFRKETMFFNGHPCSIYGIAIQTAPNTFVFDDHQDDPETHCQLQATFSKSKIEFQDITPRNTSLEWQSACHSYCGARGVIGDSWDRDKRRTIRYMSRIKNSLQYKAAIESYEHKVSTRDAYKQEWKKEHPSPEKTKDDWRTIPQDTWLTK